LQRVQVEVLYVARPFPSVAFGKGSDYARLTLFMVPCVNSMRGMLICSRGESKWNFQGHGCSVLVLNLRNPTQM